MIEANKLTKIYESESKEQIVAVNELNVQFEKTGLYMILGKSGSGKTTFLNMLSGLDSSDGGQLIMNDKEVSAFSQEQWDEFRRRDIGIVFQNFNLISELNVFNNIALSLRLLELDEDDIKNEVENVLRLVGLSGYEKRKISELSTGQQQRIAIARAIVKRPKILLLDEPTGNLDELNTKEIFQLLKQIATFCLVVVVSHDVANANRFGDRLIYIRDGNIISDVINRNKNIGEIDTITISDTKHGFCKEIKGCDGKQVQDVIQELIENCHKTAEKEKLSFDLKVYVQTKPEEETCSVNYQKEEFFVENKRSGMAWKDLFSFAYMNFKSRKVRLAITGIMFVFVTVYAMLLVTLVSYDYKDTMVKYLNDNEITELKLYRKKEYTNVLGEKKSVVTYNGEAFQNDLRKMAGKDRIIGGTYFDEIAVKDKALWDIPIYVYETFEIYKDPIVGSFPADGNEILITDYLAEKLFGVKDDFESVIGQSVKSYEFDYMVTGVVPTGYEKDDTLYSEKAYLDKYGYTFATPNLVENRRNNSYYIAVKATDFTKEGSIDSYIASKMRYSSLNLADENALLWGRYPSNENEVIISALLADRIELDYHNAEPFVKKYKPKDLKAPQYENAFDCMNLKEYFPDGVQVVGVYDNYYKESLYDTEVLVNNGIYSRMEEEYYRYYYYDFLKVQFENINMQFVKELEQDNITIQEIGCEYIYNFVTFIKNIKKVLILLFIIAVVILASFLVSYMSYSVKDQSRKIGILRALGIPKRNIVAIFLLNMLALTAVSIGMATIVYLFLIRELNLVYISYMVGVRFSIVNVQPMLILETLIAILIGSFVTTIIPIQQMSKKSPIMLLKENTSYH